MFYKTRKKITDFIVRFVPSQRLKRAVQKTLLCQYDWFRIRYNMGKYSYMGASSSIVDKNTTIGSYCSIGDAVFIGVTKHPINFLTTHPVAYGPKKYKLFGDIESSKENRINMAGFNKPCRIGNDVWIGRRATIMQGVNIGDGAIIGTSAVVTKDVPPYAIVGGVPAKLIRYRFDENTIKTLLEIKWWHLPEEFITTLPFYDLNLCIEKIKKYRQQNSIN